jgi:hypothetical protein
VTSRQGPRTGINSTLPQERSRLALAAWVQLGTASAAASPFAARPRPNTTIRPNR